MATNEEAVRYLEQIGVGNSNYIVGRLVERGFIIPDPLKTNPEVIVDTVKKWLMKNGVIAPATILDRATGWDTAGWEVVLDEKNISIPMHKDIFLALQILAKEAAAKEDVMGDFINKY